jgi:hypothetical protein
MININMLLFILVAFSFSSCEKDYGNLNGPTVEEFLNNSSKTS